MADGNGNNGSRGSPRSFASVLLDHGHGELNAYLSKQLQDLTAAIDEQAEANGRAKGELTLKFKVTGERGGQVIIKPEVSTKVPKGDVMSSTFWVDSSLNLVPQDPRQTNIDDVIKLNGRKNIEKV